MDIGRDPVTGERKQKTKGGFKTKKEAQYACAELINKGINVIEKNQSLKEYLYEWLELYAKQKVRDTTFKNYKRAIDARIIPQLGNLKIIELCPTHGQKFVQYLINKGLSPRYIEYIFIILKGAIEQAVKGSLY